MIIKNLLLIATEEPKRGKKYLFVMKKRNEEILFEDTVITIEEIICSNEQKSFFWVINKRYKILPYIQMKEISEKIGVIKTTPKVGYLSRFKEINFDKLGSMNSVNEILKIRTTDTVIKFVQEFNNYYEVETVKGSKYFLIQE